MAMRLQLQDNRYGKARVRLVRVKRCASRHDFSEWEVGVLLRGEFDSCFEDGDNSKILPTDSMKNTIYSLARSSSSACMEDFAKEVVDFMLIRNPQVSQAEVSVSEKRWEHLSQRVPHPTTFVQSSQERQNTTVSRPQNGAFTVVSGLEDLVIMKTADSGFEGYIKDELTTLPESRDRLFGTSVWSQWKYSQSATSSDATNPNSISSNSTNLKSLRTNIRETLLSVFADHKSKSVQHTLYAMAEGVLGAVPEVEEIELRMPNLHCLLVDLSRFGQDNPNEIFVPIDEPHGYIEARIRRKE